MLHYAFNWKTHFLLFLFTHYLFSKIILSQQSLKTDGMEQEGGLSLFPPLISAFTTPYSIFTQPGTTVKKIYSKFYNFHCKEGG